MYILKNNKISTITYLLTLFILSCQNQQDSVRKNGQNEETLANQQEEKRVDSTETVSFQDAALDDLYRHYEALRDALIDSNPQEARIAALLLSEASTTSKTQPSLTQWSNAIIDSQQIYDQRTAFYEMSKILMDYIKTNGTHNGNLFIAHCPMAFDDKGAEWISTEKAIRNPYFGEEMLECGMIQDTL